MKPKTVWLLCFAVVGWLVVAAELFRFPTGVDYYYTFKPALDGWLNGQAVFDAPYYGFFNAPWLLILLLPLADLSVKGGQALLALLSVAGLLSGWRIFTKSMSGYVLPWSLALILVNLHLVDLLLRAQIDIFILFGLLLMYRGVERSKPYVLGSGWVLAVIRPTSIILLFPYTLWKAYQGGYLRRAWIMPLVAMSSSLIIFDPAWMWRWYRMIRFEAPPQPGNWFVTWWQAAKVLKISPLFPAFITIFILVVTYWAMQRYQPNLKIAYAFLTAASLVVVPYALSYHYSVLMVVFIPPLLNWKLRLIIPLYLLTFTPLLRLYLGTEFSWIDIFFPFFAWVCYLFYFHSHSVEIQRRNLA